MKNQRQSTDGLSVYELCFLILPSIPEDKVSDAVSLIRGVLKNEGGKEIDSEAPFKYGLAYSMSKTVGASRYRVSEAYLGWLKFELDPAKIESVKVGVEKINEVLRFLLVKAPRETKFTFAKATALAKERERERRETEKGVAPSSAEGAVVN